jgi:REP-associated tyrosine transposase
MLSISGTFWQDESYHHCVRDEDELARIFDYIELNPVKARLCASREEWKWSSAYGREVIKVAGQASRLP